MSYSPRRGWDWARFSEIAQIAANLVNPSEWQDLPHIAPDNIARNTGTLLAYRTIRADGVTSPKHRFYPGQILYSKIRPYLNKCVRVNFEGLCSADMYPIVAYVDASYLHHYMLTREFVAAVSEASGSRTVLPKTNQAQLADVPVPIAPLLEQRRIVDAIESYFTRLDDAVATLQRVQRNLKHYRASVLKAAVEGRLVATEAELARTDGRSYEPASALLERILAERRRRWEEAELAKLKAKGKAPGDDRWKTRYPVPAAPDTTDLPRLPEGWCWACVDQLASLVRNGYSKKPARDGSVRILRINAVRAMSVDFADARWLPGSPQDYKDDLIAPGDLLFTRYNGTPALVGVSGLVRSVDRPTVHPDKLIKVRPIPLNVDASYLELATNAGVSRRFLEARTRTTAGQAGVSGGDIRQMPVPLPPLVEQQRISREAARLLTLADSAGESLAFNEFRTTRLRQSILKWAFEGRLVDPDPTDESAARLLERIRAERESTGNHTSARRRSRRPRPQSGNTGAPDSLEPHP